MIDFSHLAAENLGAAGDLLTSVAQPIKVDKEVVSGDTPSLDTFAIAVAATITLMFVTVLLVAGSLALEREENAFARLTRGLVSKSALLGEKVLLGVVVAIVVTLADARRPRPLRRSRLGTVRALDPRRSSPAAPASPPSAPRSAVPRRRSGRRRCSPS